MRLVVLCQAGLRLAIPRAIKMVIWWIPCFQWSRLISPSNCRSTIRNCSSPTYMNQLAYSFRGPSCTSYSLTLNCIPCYLHMLSYYESDPLPLLMTNSSPWQTAHRNRWFSQRPPFILGIVHSFLYVYQRQKTILYYHTSLQCGAPQL
jgi:hypothetical protein